MASGELATIAQKATRGGLYLLVGYASSTVILAVGAILVARLLGPSSYGLYTLSVSIPTLLVALSDVGINSALIRMPARARSEGDHAKANRLVRLGFAVKLVVSIAVSFGCYLGSTAIATITLGRPELTPFIQLASLMIVFQAIYDATNSAFIGQDLMHFSAGQQIMQAVLKGILGPVFVFIGMGIAGAVSGYVLALAAAGATGAAILFTRHGGSSIGCFDSASMEIRAMLGYGLPLYIANALFVFSSQYQNIVLAHFASNLEIGNFGATWRFTAFMMILIYPITTAMFPMFSKMDARSQRNELARGFVLAVKYTSLLMVPASVAVMVFSRDLIYLTFGSSYTLASQYLILLSAQYLLTVMSYLVLGSFLSGVAETQTVLKITLLAIAFDLPLVPALAWIWGPCGVLVANILGNAASTVYGLGQVSLKFHTWPDLGAGGRILLAALGAAVPTVVLIQLDGAGIGVANLVVGGMLFLALYLTLAPFVGAVDKQDISNLRTVLCGTRMVAKLVKPILDFEIRLLSAIE